MSKSILSKNILYVTFIFLSCLLQANNPAKEDSLKTNLEQDYELAWKNYLIKDYKTARDILLPYYNRGNAPQDVYQLLGNIYDQLSDRLRAISIYDEGLSKYPKAGCLFLEKGNMEFKDGRYQQALYWYEKGIEAEPMFASNYYCASQVYFLSTEIVWAIMYGELFMLLERETPRCQQMSKDLFEAYFNCINISAKQVSCDFYNTIIVYSDSFERPNLFPTTFNNLMQKACKNEHFVNIASLTRIRQKFLNYIYLYAKDMDNVLFAYHKKLIESSNFEAYNYWLFAYGNSSEAASWIRTNKDKMDKMSKFLKQNPLTLSDSNLFTRYLME